MVTQKGSVKQGADADAKTVCRAPKTPAVAIAPPADKAMDDRECTQKTPTPRLVKAELNPHKPMATSAGT